MHLHVKNVSFQYAAHGVLQGVHFTVPPGRLLGIVGPNGAGKSTLLQVMSRSLSPNQGTVCLDGTDITKLPRRNLAKKMAVVRQHEHVAFDFTVEDVVLLGRLPYLGPLGNEKAVDFQAAQKGMRRAEIEHLARRRFSELSGGERQRVALARALAQTTDVLLLDEPTSSLDIKYQVRTLQLLAELAEQGRTVVLVLHDLNLASQYCDQLLLLHQGRIWQAGSATQVLTTSVLQDVYGVEVLVTAHPQSGLPVVLPPAHAGMKELKEV